MDTLTSIGYGLVYIAVGLAMLGVAKLIRDVVTPYKLDDELTGKDNPALGLAMSGYFLGVMIVFLGAALGPEPATRPSVRELGFELLTVCGYTLGGVVLLNIGNVLLDRCILSSFKIHKEIVDDRNAGTGAVVFGSYIATAMVVAGAIYGEVTIAWWHGVVSALVFFVLGQVTLILFGALYRLITKFDLHAEIERDNVAAGVAFGLSIVAIGIVLLKASGQDFAAIEMAIGEQKAAEIAVVDAAGAMSAATFDPETGDLIVTPTEKWRYALVDFGYYAAGGFIVIALLRRVTDALLLPGTTIFEEIGRDKNLAAALIEGSVACGVASMVYFMI
ncbi:MAG: DUF350 domain-containing protein [Bacteroidota bacterium]